MKKALVLTVIMMAGIVTVFAARVWAMHSAALREFIANPQVRIAEMQTDPVERPDGGFGNGSLYDSPVDVEGDHRVLLSKGGRRRIPLPDGEGLPADADGDGDGVSDHLDACPKTASGVSVDARGCPVDSDQDGVPDYLDACPDTPRGASINEQGCWVITGAHFDPGKWHINRGLYPELDEIVAILKGNPSLRVEIQGHTDNTGPEAQNLVLSHRRACAVMDYLVSKGVESTRLFAGGYGSSKPMASNRTAQGRARNRRVELVPIP